MIEVLFAVIFVYTLASVGTAIGIVAATEREGLAIIGGLWWPIGLPILAGYVIGKRLRRRKRTIPVMRVVR